MFVRRHMFGEDEVFSMSVEYGRHETKDSKTTLSLSDSVSVTQ